MKNLFFIGCSLTYGDDLSSRETHSWPALIAKDTNSTFENYAISGGTNERNLYHTIKNTDQFDHYYIAWTFMSRFTRYRKDNNFEINFNQQLINKLYGDDLSYSAYGKIHYQYWFNELFAFKIWLQQILMLQSYLKDRNLSYTMINTAHNNIDKWSSPWESFIVNTKNLLCFDIMNDEQLFEEHQEIQKYIKEIDKKHFLGWNTWSIEKLLPQYPVGPTNHLLEEGHRAVADYILKHD